MGKEIDSIRKDSTPTGLDSCHDVMYKHLKKKEAL